MMAVVSEDPDPPQHAGILWPVISGLLATDPADRLSPAAAEQMLRQVAETGGARVTAPLPRPDPPPGPDPSASPAGASRREPPGNLERAERTRALHTGASMVQETAVGSPGLAEPPAPPEPLRPHGGSHPPTGPIGI